MTKAPCVYCGKITGCYFEMPDRTPVHACIKCMKAKMIEEAKAPAPQEDETPHIPPIITCPKCGATAMAFVCSERGCPVNGGAAYE